MSRRPPQDHSASSNDVPTITSPVNSSYPAGILRPPPANRAISEPFGGYDVPASSTTPNARPLRSILTNPIPPPSVPRVRFLIPQSSTEIRDRLAGREGLVDSPGSTASTASRDGAYSDSDPEGEEQQRQPRRQSSQEPRDLSDIIGRSVRGFVRRNFDRNTRGQEQERERDPNRGSISRGVDEQPYRTRNNGSPAQSDTSSVIASPELRRASLANTTGRNSPLQRFGARSINELRTVPSRASTVDSITSEPKPTKPEDLTKAPPPQIPQPQPQPQPQSQPLAESGRPRPRSPARRRSSGHDSYHGPGQADAYYYGTPAAEQEPGVYYGPPPPKMPTPPPPPAMVPPKYKPGGGSAAEFYNPDNVDPDAAIPIQEGSQYELTITTGAGGSGMGPQPPQPSSGSFFGGPITAEPTSSLPGGFPETPINASAPTSFSTAPSNPSYPPQTQVQLSYAPPTNPGAPAPTVNATGGATITTGTMSVIDAATLAEMAYDQSLANQQRPTSTATHSQAVPNLANLPPLPPSTAPTYTSPYAPPPHAINTNIQTVIPPRPLTTMSPVPIQSPVLVAPKPQHSSNMVPAIAAAVVAGGAIGGALHASHSQSASISSQTSYSHSSQSYIPAPPSHQPPPPPPLAAITSPTTGKPKPPPKPAKPLLLSGIFAGKRPSISSPTVSQSGSSVGGKIIATGVVGATAAVATAIASQSSGSSSKPNLPPLITNPAVKPPPSFSNHGKTTAAVVVGTAALTVAAVASHKKEKEKQKISNKPSGTSSSSGDVTRIHGLKGKANYNRRSNDIRGVKLPSAMNAFDSASSSDFLFDSDSDSSSSSSSSSHGKRRKHKGKHEKKKGKDRAVEDLSSSHSSMDFGGDDAVGRHRGSAKSYGALGAATSAAITIPGVVSDLNHSEDEGSSPRNRPGSHMRKKSTDSDLAFGRSVGSNVSGYTSDSSMYSSKQSPEAGNGFQFWAVRNRTGRRKARRVSSRESVNSVNSALGFGDSSDESKPGSKGWLRKRESLDSNLAFGLSSASTSRRSSYASGLREKFTIEEEDSDEYDGNGRRKNQESPTMVKAALETAAAYTAAEAARRKSHDRRPSEGIIVAPGHRLITEEQRMADYERLDRMRLEELKKDIARQKEAARLSELENDRKEKEKFDRERMERRRKEEEFRREKQWMIEEEERRGSIQRQVTPFYYYY
ncbi:hypothetical protein TWF718_006477 [Orbilia javanica]|uniref:Uncharacterized protein n=1 Tax=Orbilia javanica TaxID=47235 RepID=A0AAN8N9X3_9PEZI